MPTIISRNSPQSASRQKKLLFDEKGWKYLSLVKDLSLTAFVSNPLAPHQVSSFSLGFSVSNTELSKGAHTWVRKWTSGTANNQSWRSRWLLLTCLQIPWMASPIFLHTHTQKDHRYYSLAYSSLMQRCLQKKIICLNTESFQVRKLNKMEYRDI